MLVHFFERMILFDRHRADRISINIIKKKYEVSHQQIHVPVSISETDSFRPLMSIVDHMRRMFATVKHH